MIDKGVIPVIFNEGIYVIEEEAKSNSENETVQINGNKESRVLCAYLEKDAVNPSQDQLEMVSKLLGAIKINAQDHCWTSQSEVFNQKKHLKEVVFLFQHDSITKLKGASKHEWFDFQGVQIFKTYSLSELESDKLKKRELWEAIQNFRME